MINSGLRLWILKNYRYIFLWNKLTILLYFTVHIFLAFPSTIVYNNLILFLKIYTNPQNQFKTQLETIHKNVTQVSTVLG